MTKQIFYLMWKNPGCVIPRSHPSRDQKGLHSEAGSGLAPIRRFTVAWAVQD